MCTLGERIDRIVFAATGLNRTATMNSAADFHGTGDDARVFAFPDTRVAPGSGAPRVVWETGRRLDSEIFDAWTALTNAQACTPAAAA